MSADDALGPDDVARETEVGDSRALAIPDLALVVLIGASGSGKSTFARRHFLPTQVLSSDFFRGLVADDENDQAATPTPSTSCTTPLPPGCGPAG